MIYFNDVQRLACSATPSGLIIKQYIFICDSTAAQPQTTALNGEAPCSVALKCKENRNIFTFVTFNVPTDDHPNCK